MRAPAYSSDDSVSAPPLLATRYPGCTRCPQLSRERTGRELAGSSTCTCHTAERRMNREPGCCRSLRCTRPSAGVYGRTCGRQECVSSLHTGDIGHSDNNAGVIVDPVTPYVCSPKQYSLEDTVPQQCFPWINKALVFPILRTLIKQIKEIL